MVERQSHWERVYAEKADDAVSWYQASPDASLALIERCGFGPDARVIDVGGGSARVVDALLDRAFGNVTVLDIADKALANARRRLGPRAARAAWIVADVTIWRPTGQFDVWHDRAVFHFLTEGADRAAYRAVLERALAPAGQVVIGTFAPDGPERCSGLPVERYDAASLGRELGPAFRLQETVRDDHVTPKGAVQRFQFCRFLRVG